MPPLTQTPESFLEVLNVNTVSLATTVRSTLPALRKSGGAVVFVSSGAANGNYGSWASYKYVARLTSSASKAALNAYSRTLANEERNIACFAVRPGVVDTDMQGIIRSTEHMPKEQQAKFMDMHKNGQLLPADKPAHVLSALAVLGTRETPRDDNGAPIGANGAFVSWDERCLAAFQLP